MTITKVKRAKGRAADIQRVVDTITYCAARCTVCANLGMFTGCNRSWGHTGAHRCGNTTQGPHEW